jgi:hypothetical protein
MRDALAGAAHAVLEHVGDKRTAVELMGAERTRMIHLATPAVRSRSAVERESYTHEIELIPEPEAPARLAQSSLGSSPPSAPSASNGPRRGAWWPGWRSSRC